MFVALMINGIVIGAGIGGGYFFTVIVQGGSAGAFLSSFTALASLPDLYISMVKALIFGFIATIVAAHKGMSAKGGPKGVADAVNQAVVLSVILLAVVNVGITQAYVMLVPQGVA